MSALIKEFRVGRDAFRKVFLLDKLPFLHPGYSFEVPAKIFVQCFFRLVGDHFDNPGGDLKF